MLEMDVESPPTLALTPSPSQSPAPTGQCRNVLSLSDTTIETNANGSTAEDCHALEAPCDAAAAAAAADTLATDNKATTFDIYDYVGICEEEPFGALHIAYSCPHPLGSGCDGFSLSSLDECAEHERDWHAGPYRCRICGQIFASEPRLRRHEHFADSEARRELVDDATTKRLGHAAVRVYHGNDIARRRARRLRRLVELDAAAAAKDGAKEAKKMERLVKAVLKKETTRKRNKDGPLVVIGTNDGGPEVERGEEEEKEEEEGRMLMLACEEPCCPFFERRFATKANQARHNKSHGHEVAVRMGEALLQQLTTMGAAASSSTRQDVEVAGCGRQNTPPPQRALDAQTQLLSPPPTPHGMDQDHSDEEWDETEKLPMTLELRLARTRLALRELRCNAPGCWMHGCKMSSSANYWSHLASPAHVAALRAWSGNGGESVYVPF
ncbi:hypothetical protein PWT90_09309 [Aphanocladium album]|nr:hypothetical protein PWT90_09309 [Aphanocladium album]